MIKHCLLFLLALILTVGVTAQEVERTIIVEHFTNTRCGICSSRNPGFYNNLNAQEGILHLSIHPSSPYSSCLFNQANPAENDARTNYYNVYGGTPRLVIQGNAVSAGTNYGSAAIFEPYQGQTTPVSIDIRQTKVGGEIAVEVILTAEADNALGTAALFLALAEREVMYDAPNGEDVHYDVFRQTFTGEPTGISIDVPAAAGTSTSVSYALTPTADWVFDELFAVAVLQETESKAVIQAAASDPSDNEPVATREVNTLPAILFPNPVTNVLNVRLDAAATASYRLLDAAGRVRQTGTVNGNANLDLTAYAAGVYWLELWNEEGKTVRKVVK